MSIDADIEDFGEPITIIRGAGNVSTYFLITSKGVTGTSYDRLAMMPTDSGVVSGDLIQHGSDYYLVVALLEKRAVGEFFYITARLFKCNETVTIRTFNTSTKVFEDSTTGVRCLIVSVSDTGPEDKGTIVTAHSGKDPLFNCFVQSGSGLSESTMLVDSANRELRVTKDIDAYFAGGILKAVVKVEKNA